MELTSLRLGLKNQGVIGYASWLRIGTLLNNPWPESYNDLVHWDLKERIDLVVSAYRPVDVGRDIVFPEIQTWS